MISMELEGKLAMTIATVAFAACAHSSWAAGAGPAARIGGDRLPASRGGTGIDGTPPGPGDDLDGSAGIGMMGPRNPLGGPYTQTK